MGWHLHPTPAGMGLGCMLRPNRTGRRRRPGPPPSRLSLSPVCTNRRSPFHELAPSLLAVARLHPVLVELDKFAVRGLGEFGKGRDCVFVDLIVNPLSAQGSSQRRFGDFMWVAGEVRERSEITYVRRDHDKCQVYRCALG